jgi:hypothetical protein
MRYYYIAATVCEYGKYYSFVIKVSESDNILSKLAIKNIITANICPTKKYADKLVEEWINSFKANGNYMFDDILREK